jgi:hypothetical protein
MLKNPTPLPGWWILRNIEDATLLVRNNGFEVFYLSIETSYSLDFKLYYSHRNKNSIVLAQTQTCSQWGRIKHPEINHTATAIWFLTRESKTYVGEKTASSINGARKTGYL